MNNFSFEKQNMGKCGDGKCTSSCSSDEKSHCTSKSKTSKSKCCKRDCEIERCDCLSPEEICCQFHDAVVTVTAEFILARGATGGVGPGLTGGVGLGSSTRVDYILQSNGFRIKGGYFVFPSHIALMPPTLTGAVLRYPYGYTNDNIGINMLNKMVRASRILITVRNVNNKGKAFLYEATLLGVDGAGDLAVAKIDMQREFNKCNPCIEKCHPYFRWGKSKASYCGEEVYMLGTALQSFYGKFGEVDKQVNYNSRGNNGTFFTVGRMADPRSTDPSGFALQECILVAASTAADGVPVLDCSGKVLGMVTRNRNRLTENQGFLQQLVAGPSQYFSKRVIRAILKGNCNKRYTDRLESIIDPAGAYVRYLKGYAGIGYQVFGAENYTYTIDYTSGDFPYGFPRIRLDKNGDFLCGPDCKQEIGIKIVSIAGLVSGAADNTPNGQRFTPGTTLTAAPFPVMADAPVDSPVLGQLLPGDLITKIGVMGKNNKCKYVNLGDLRDQIAPALLTWRTVAGDIISLQYNRGDNILNTDNNGDPSNDFYNCYKTIQVVLAQFPQLLDYPWYAANSWPDLTMAPYSFPFALFDGASNLPQTLSTAQGRFQPAF